MRLNFHNCGILDKFGQIIRPSKTVDQKLNCVFLLDRFKIDSFFLLFLFIQNQIVRL